MSILVFDSGALIALERNKRAVWALLEAAYEAGARAQVPACALAQVWNGEPSQARLNQALKMCRTIPLDEGMAHIAGRLRMISGIDDVTDASVAAAAALATNLSSVVVATSDESDISQLIGAAHSVRPLLVHDEIRIHPA